MAPRTLRDLRYYLHTLGKFFAERTLDSITPDDIAAYQDARANGIGFQRRFGDRVEQSFAGPGRINDEVGVLKRLLRAAGISTGPHDDCRRLQEMESPIPKALTAEEQETFLRTAAGNEDWHILWWYSIVAEHTLFSSDEMRTIRQGDINLPQGLLSVNRAYGKNRYRRRTVAITSADCIWALERLLERSRDLVGEGASHFLLPRRVKRGQYSAALPISESGLRKPFEAVRAAAGMPWFKLNSWRHTGITNLAVQGVPIAIIMRRAGHTTMQMTMHYTQISEQAERRELQRAAQQMRKPPQPVRPQGRWDGYGQSA